MARLFKQETYRTNSTTGKRTKHISEKWYCCYYDVTGTRRRKSLARDKQVAQKMLDDILQRVEREKAGMFDPAEEHMLKPIREHLDAFRSYIVSKGGTSKNVDDTMVRVNKIVAVADWQRIADILAGDVTKYLARLKKAGRSIETQNHYLRSAKHFTRWLVKDRRMSYDPLSHLSVQNADVERKVQRRAITDEEFMRLLDAAETGPRLEKLTGPHRAVIYILAAWTGFRKGEIGSLTRKSFKLDGKVPTVTVQAGYSKHRRVDTQILHPTVVRVMRQWLDRLSDLQPNELLFPISSRIPAIPISGKSNRYTIWTSGKKQYPIPERRMADIIRRDLEAARRKWIAESRVATDDLPLSSQSSRSALMAELERREKSDFLTYKNHDGHVADFHALRHTFITNLSRSGVSPKTAQTLARHSDIRLTMNIYTHTDIDEQAEAINKLPGLDEDV